MEDDDTGEKEGVTAGVGGRWRRGEGRDPGHGAEVVASMD